MAKMKKLEDLFHDTLTDVYFANKKLTCSDRATSSSC